LGNGRDDVLTSLERQAQKDGLAYIEELVFENGAVYKGNYIALTTTNIYQNYI